MAENKNTNYMKATITKIEQSDGYVGITLNIDASSEIEAYGEFQPSSLFSTANGGVEFCLFTDEIFNVSDTFDNGEWVKCQLPSGQAEKMKSFDVGAQQAAMLSTWGEKIGSR